MRKSIKTTFISPIQLLIPLMCLIAIPNWSFAIEKSEFSKNYDKSISVSSDVYFEINSSFADVSVSNWDKNEISMNVEITVKAKNQDDADRLYKTMEIDLSGGGSSAELECELESDWGKNGCNKDENMSVKITLKVPSNTKYEIDHSFGDFNIDAIQNKCEIDMSYGEFTAGAITHKDSEINVAFGNGFIGATAAREVSIEFGELTVGTLDGDCEIQSSYSSCEVKNISASCNSIEANNEFGELDLNLDPTGSYDIEGYTSFGSIDFDSKIDYKIEKDGFSSEEYTAKYGGGSSNTEIELNNSFGEINLRIN